MKKQEVVWSRSDVLELKKRLEYYRYKMFLNEWQFDLKFDEGFCEEDGTLDKSIAANTDVLFEYKKANITFYKPSKMEWKKNGGEGIDCIIKHELAHSVTDRLTKLAEERFVNQREIDKECEILTQYITNCVKSDYKKDVRRYKSARNNKRRKVLAKRKK